MNFVFQSVCVCRDASGLHEHMSHVTGSFSLDTTLHRILKPRSCKRLPVVIKISL